MIYVLHLALAVTMFLTVLNGFLQGAKKARIDAFLGVLLLALLLAAFLGFGWKAGVVALILSFVYDAASRPIAASASARLLSSPDGEPSGAYVGLPPRALERISRELGRERSSKQLARELASGSGRRQRAEAALLDYCIAKPEIRGLMDEFGAGRTTLDQLYRWLLMAGAGQWAVGHFVAASALAYPKPLRFLLKSQKSGLSDWEQTSAVIMHFERGAPLP